MTQYTKKHNDNALDAKIISIYLESKSIAKTLWKMKENYGAILSRAEVVKLLESHNLGDKIIKRGKYER